jgi:hypothetical protein
MARQQAVHRPQPGQNRIHLGPLARRVIRAVARVVNPLTLIIAGRRFMPIVGVVRHRGVRTGRIYSTPLGMRPLGDGFVMPLTFSEAAHWYRNTIAAGGCVISYLGQDYRTVTPEIVSGAEGAGAFPRYEQALFRLIGIDEYLWVHRKVPPKAG